MKAMVAPHFPSFATEAEARAHAEARGGAVILIRKTYGAYTHTLQRWDGITRSDLRTARLAAAQVPGAYVEIIRRSA